MIIYADTIGIYTVGAGAYGPDTIGANTIDPDTNEGDTSSSDTIAAEKRYPDTFSRHIVETDTYVPDAIGPIGTFGPDKLVPQFTEAKFNLDYRPQFQPNHAR